MIRRICSLVVFSFIIPFIVMGLTGAGTGANKPRTVTEIALYQGPDREQFLVEGAKKEAQVVFYNSLTTLDRVVQVFEKKYPFIKVMTWRGESPSLAKRVAEEYVASRSSADVIETSGGTVALLHSQGLFQEYYCPEAAAYGEEFKARGKTGVFYLADRENYTSLAFNTKLISPVEAPSSFKELLDPKWKGKMTISGGGIGPRWIGNVLNSMGKDFLDKLSHQEMKVQNIAPAALINQVISGEIPLSPTMQDSNVFTAKQTGAPIEWRPLEPVLANLGSSAIMNKAPHPHAAMLLLDYLHSREAQQVLLKGGVSSPREDAGSLHQRFKKIYLENQYTPQEFDRKFNEWQEVMINLFVRKR